MRPMTLTPTSEADEQLLTTGEAASILNCSRQHVVDLCNGGDLPFTTVGKHRRVRRSDIDAIRTRTQRMTRDQKRSLWLAYALAGQIVTDPARAGRIARQNLDRMRRTSRGRTQKWLDEWDRLLDGSLERLLGVLTSRSPRARELRQNSPFAGLLDEDERQQVLRSWRECGMR